MIGKKISNPDKSASKARRITALLEYIRAPERDDAAEKCVHHGTRNFITEEPADQIAEMVALAQGATRSRDPIVHYVISFREHEQPTPEQVDAAIDTVQATLKIGELQLVYALHADTRNWHTHIVINRVSPETEKPVQINKGFDIDALQRAVALVEHEQGWQTDANKRWKIRNGQAVPADPEPASPDRPKRPARPKAKQNRRPGQRRRDISHQKDEPSATEQAIETLGPVFAGTDGWQRLHAALEEHQAKYERVANGAGGVVHWRGVTIKASAIHREASLRRLERRFGCPYEPLAAETAKDEQVKPLHPLRAWPIVECALEDPTSERPWDPVHAALARHGLAYETAGSGSRIRNVHDPDWTVTASRVHRNASRKRLEDQLGPWQAPSEAVQRILQDAVAAMSTPAAAPTDHAAARPILEITGAWQQAHADLKEIGLQCRRKGSGLEIDNGVTSVKASAISRKCSLGALQRRLGPYQSPTPELTRAPGTGEGTRATESEYAQERDAYRAERDAEWLVHERQYEQERTRVKQQQAEERDELRMVDWAGRGADLNAHRHALATRHRAQLEALREERRKAKARHGKGWPAFPDYRTWRTGAWHEFSNQDAGTDTEPHQDIRNYRPKVIPAGTAYHHQDRPTRPDFIDHGRRVRVLRVDPDAVLASLELAKAKGWKGVRINGRNPHFIELSIRYAVTLGLKIGNPELQAQVAREQARQRQAAETEAETEPELPTAPPTALLLPADIDTRPKPIERLPGYETRWTGSRRDGLQFVRDGQVRFAAGPYGVETQAEASVADLKAAMRCAQEAFGEIKYEPGRGAHHQSRHENLLHRLAAKQKIDLSGRTAATVAIGGDGQRRGLSRSKAQQYGED